MIEFTIDDIFNGKLEKFIIAGVAFTVHSMHNDTPIAYEESKEVKKDILRTASRVIKNTQLYGKMYDIMAIRYVIGAVFDTMLDYVESDTDVFDGIYEKIHTVTGKDKDDELWKQFNESYIYYVTIQASYNSNIVGPFFEEPYLDRAKVGTSQPQWMHCDKWL